jgi:hypothetical protein
MDLEMGIERAEAKGKGKGKGKGQGGKSDPPAD